MSSRSFPAWAAIAALLAVTPVMSAQTSSDSYSLVKHRIATLSGAQDGSTYTLRTSAGGSTATGLLASGSYTLHVGVLPSSGLLDMLGGPQVFGVNPSPGGMAGGQLVTLHGRNLDPAGLAVDFGGTPAAIVRFISPTAVQVLTPPGSSEQGNPLGSVTVDVRNARGSHQAVGAYVYTPALILDGPATVETGAALRFRGAPGTTVALFAGLAAPARPVPGVEGALELFHPRPILLSDAIAESGELPLGIPLAGLSRAIEALAFQAVCRSAAAPDPVFTNLLVVPVQH